MSRELDVQVAEEIFGWERHGCDDYIGAPCFYSPDRSPDRWIPPFYSTDLDSAFEVEAWLFERGYQLSLFRCRDGKWDAVATRTIGSMSSSWHSDAGAPLPEVICWMALKVARLEASNG